MAAEVVKKEEQTEQTVPLVMYHDDRRVVIGTATVDVETLRVKGHVSAEAGELTEIAATVFRFG